MYIIFIIIITFIYLSCNIIYYIYIISADGVQTNYISFDFFLSHHSNHFKFTSQRNKNRRHERVRIHSSETLNQVFLPLVMYTHE